MFRLFAYPRTSTLARVCLIVILASLPLALIIKARSGDDQVVVEDGPAQSEIDAQSDTGTQNSLPDFEAITNVDLKKETFFTFLNSYVEAENQRILERREKVLVFAKVLTDGGSLSATEQVTFDELVVQYRLQGSELSPLDLVDELLVRVDIIPVSLALAQAATESAWGTSRFAREGNNIFGQWCFDEGCGLVPGQRADDASHEVKSFATVEGSIRAYFRNLNTNPSYAYLRELRAQMRMKEKPLDSRALAQGLLRYSERGHVYISELHDIIRINDLLARDRQS
jgi:Bax protein